VDNWATTSLERKIDLEKLVSLEVTIFPEEIPQEFGVELVLSNAHPDNRPGIFLFINTNNKLVSGTAQNKDVKPKWEEAKYQPPLNMPLKFKMEKVQGDNNPQLKLYVNDNFISSITLGYTQQKEGALSIFARALKDNSYRISVTKVKILERKSEK